MNILSLKSLGKVFNLTKELGTLLRAEVPKRAIAAPVVIKRQEGLFSRIDRRRKFSQSN